MTLAEDLEHLRDYLNLQSLRLGEEFSWDMQCDESILDEEVPRLILQPVVENGIKYGFTGEMPLRLELKIQRTEDRLIAEVFNDGPPIDPCQLEKLRESFQNDHCSGNHIGLYNTNRRLKLLYGEKAGLLLKSGAEGTHVILFMKCFGPEEPV